VRQVSRIWIEEFKEQLEGQSVGDKWELHAKNNCSEERIVRVMTIWKGKTNESLRACRGWLPPHRIFPNSAALRTLGIGFPS
jgi:hypothetical protein